MNKLKDDVWYYARCEHCQEMNGYYARGRNVNQMSDSEVKSIAERRLGTCVKSDCIHCRMYTLQTIVAYRWEEL